MKNTAAVFVTYNHVPDKGVLETVLSNLDYLLLFDNGSGNKYIDVIKKICTELGPRCMMIMEAENIGISKAYNKSIQFLKNLNVYWVYFFDHDAFFSNELFVQTKKYFENFETNKLGLLVPIVSDKPNLLNSFIFYRNPITKIHNAITSGMMTNIEIFQNVNGFDEDFFVENADYAFSQRIIRAGLDIARINQILIVQKFEEKPNGNKTLLSLFDSVIRYRSLIRVGIGNSNIFRTEVSVYNSIRREDLKNSLKLLSHKLPEDKIYIYTVRFLNLVEEILISFLNNSMKKDKQ